ncbi:hypothetical protein ABZ747_17735 [Kitasatospora cineracea]|uniref:hypothetical protein n=1 Tax=Kitasatospora cineracea TaxID=88074 RepID=UPI0033CDD8A6
MTQDRKRKQAVRARQQHTGRRYTALSREDAARHRQVGEDFSLGELLAECTTAPVTVPAWFKAVRGSDEPFWEPPKAFFSKLLGVDVPHGTVLELAGQLAQLGLDTTCRVESSDPDHRVVVATGGRRFDLCLTQEMLNECCRQPACLRGPFGDDIPWCDEHVRRRSLPELIEMADRLGYATVHEADYEPELCGGGPCADLLVQAAVAHAGSEAVIERLVSAGFDDPDSAAEWSSDDTLEMRLRYAIDRERYRLRNVARVEAVRIRRATEACPTCGAKPLLPFQLSDFPPQYCTRHCAPEPEPVVASATVWSQEVEPPY